MRTNKRRYLPIVTSEDCGILAVVTHVDILEYFVATFREEPPRAGGVVRYAPAQPQVAAAPGHQLIAVVCPPGAVPGSPIMITAPDGRCGSTGHLSVHRPRLVADDAPLCTGR